ncbi:EscU/YscU/HrcU family type III secretion system export apparatus switch protein [Acidaminobacterium chupaoyuni]
MSKSKAKGNRAAALKYEPQQDAAPIIIASGYGNTAERIIDIAEKKGIPVYRDDSAASLLCMLDVGARIPEELYQIVGGVYYQILKIAEQSGRAAGQGAPPQEEQEDTK